MKKQLTLSLLSVLLLTGCGATSSHTSADDSSTSTSSTKETIDTLKALKEIQNKEANYRLSVTKNADPISSITYFHKNYFKNSDNTGYLNENGGVSEFTYYEDTKTISRSELLVDSKNQKYTDYHDVIPNLSKLDISKMALANDNTIDIKANKQNVILILNLLGLSINNIFNVTSLVASYSPLNDDNTDPSGLTFVTTITGNEAINYTLTVSRYGQIKYNYLDDFLANPTAPFEPTDTEKRIRRLFKANNFLNENDIDGDNTIDEYYHFLPQYFYTEFTEAYKKKDPTTTAQYGDRGYITINNKVINVSSSKALVFIGAYLFYKINGEFSIVSREDPNNPGYAQSSFTQIYTDITKVMDYPSSMHCVNQFQNAEVLENGSLKFTDQTYIKEFTDNHKYTDYIKDNNLESDYLLVTPEMKDVDKDCKITFRLYLTSGQYLETIYSNFGSANVDFVDAAITKFGLAD